MGITVTDAEGQLKSTGDVLMEMADYMEQETDATKKAAMAKTLLGRGGAEMVPFLEQGSGAIKEMGEEAERLGIVLTQDNITAFKQYQDSVDRMKSSFSGLKMQVATSVLPAFNSVTDSLTDMFVKFGESGVIEDIFSNIGGIIEDLIPVMETIFEAVGDILEAFGPVLQETVERFGELLGTVFSKVAESGILEDLAEIASILADNIMSVLEDILPIATDFLNVFLDIVTPVIQFADQMGIIKGVIYAIVASKIVNTLSSMTTHMLQIAGNSAGAATAMGKMVGKVGLIGVGLAVAAPLAAEIAKAIEASNKHLEEMDEKQSEIIGNWGDMGLEARKATIEAMKAELATMKEGSLEYDNLRSDILELEDALYCNVEAINNWEENWENAMDESVIVGSAAFDEKLADANQFGEDMAEGIGNLHVQLTSMYKSQNEKERLLAAEGARGFIEGKMAVWQGVGFPEMESIKGQLFDIIANPDEYRGKGSQGMHDFLMSMADAHGVDRQKIIEIEDDIMNLLGLEGQAGTIGANTASSYATDFMAHLDKLGIDINAWIERIRSAIEQNLSANITLYLESSSSGGGMHTGGMIKAHSGLLAPDEVMIRAQKGEGIINRMATQFYGGKDFINALNSLSLGRSQNITVYNENHSDVDVDRALTQLAWRIA